MCERRLEINRRLSVSMKAALYPNLFDQRQPLWEQRQKSYMGMAKVNEIIHCGNFHMQHISTLLPKRAPLLLVAEGEGH